MEGKGGIWEHNFSSIIVNTGRNLFDPMEFRVRNNELIDYR